MKNNTYRGLQYSKKVQDYNTEFGVINRSKQHAAYIQVSAWITLNDTGLIDTQIRRFNGCLRMLLNEHLPIVFDGLNKPYNVLRTINYSETLDERKYKTKPSFLSLELTLYFNRDINIADEPINNGFANLVERIVEFIGKYEAITFAPVNNKKAPV